MMKRTGSPPGATEWLQHAKLMRKQQLCKLAQLGTLVSRISHLAHMLQCERGASNIWLCSQGALYAPECKASRALVDEQLLALQQALGSPLMASAALCERVAHALHHLEQLPTLREQIMARTLAADRAMEHYSRTLRYLLSIVPQLNDSIDDPQIAGRFVALYSLMQGKELVGQERALGAIGFTQGFFSDEMRQTLVDRIDGQQACFDVFLSLTPQQLQEHFTLSTPGAEAEQLRRLACTRQPAADNGVLALHWFSLLTERLEHLRSQEELLIADLMIAVDRLITLADDYPPEAAAVNEPLGHYPVQPLLPLVRQQAREIEQLSQQLASMRDTLEERKIIDKAKSVLMTHQQMSEDQAWCQLRKMAMDKNQRMVDIARALLTVKALWQVTPKE
ncbi:nitrate regulatory protein NasR [Leclercia sp. UBA5958]|uniref:nitrate regulatory protein NasR n=1 Tax=Leclercia sp. UBA5958 TaxID=1946742 RepID=UPI00257D93FC|nr:nitrate regulatory protein NasR [Leclercia sp. UBA5958]